MEAIAGLESAFDAPLFPTHSSHLCCHERVGWGAPKLSLPPGAGNPRYATDLTWSRDISIKLSNLCFFKQKQLFFKKYVFAVITCCVEKIITLFKRSASLRHVISSIMQLNFIFWEGVDVDARVLEPVYSNIYWVFCLASTMHVPLKVFVSLEADYELISKIRASVICWTVHHLPLCCLVTASISNYFRASHFE